MKFHTYIKSIPTFMLLGMLLFSGIFLSSCQDEEVVSEDVVLESFGPSGVKHGDKIKFIGRNLDKVSSIVLPSVEVSSAEFVSHSPSLIELVVPEAAEAGKVTLKTSQGDIVSKSMLSFLVPVVIESITAEARPGANISIKGKLVNWIEEVTFNDGLAVAEFVSKSLNEVVVTVPMEAQTGALIFKTGGTKPLSFVSEQELIVTLPAVTAISPASIKHTENLTITGTNLDLVTSIVFGGDQEVTEFVSQSATEIVVAVPAQAVKGTLTLKQASPVEVVTTEELKIILPVGTGLTPKPAVPGIDNITITGTNLDLIAELVLPGVATPVLAANFVSHTAEEIVVALPEGATAGGISYKTIHGYSSNLGVTVVLPGAGPTPLPIALYDEIMAPGGGDWSWNKVVSDPANTEQFYSGNVSWKFTTDNSGGLSSGGITAVDASSMGVFAFSLYGGPGTEGAEVAVVLNDDWSNMAKVTLAEGKWTSYELPLAEFGTVDFTKIVRFAFKVEGIAASTIYADRVGFDTGGPAPLSYYVYDDAINAEWEQWGGWGVNSQDWENTEMPFKGSKSIKVDYKADSWGAIQAHPKTTFNTSEYAQVVVSLHSVSGGKAIVYIKDDNNVAHTEHSIDLPAGQWVTAEIPMSALGNPATIKELVVKNGQAAAQVLYVDEWGFRK